MILQQSGLQRAPTTARAPRSGSGNRAGKRQDRRSPGGLRPPSFGPSSTREGLLPALPRLENEGGACQSGQGQKDPEGLSLQQASHSDQSQRRPAPRVRASDASSAMTPVKRARFAFTMDSFVRVVCRCTGDRRPGGLPRKIPGFASPPRDGFALDDEPVGERPSLRTNHRAGRTSET